MANVHPHVFREFLSLGAMCAPGTQQRVTKDMQSGGNGHVKLPTQGVLNGVNEIDNMNQTYESIFYLFKLLAYYGTEFTTRRNIETMVETCRLMRMVPATPPSFDGIRELWDRISDQLETVSEYRKPLQYKPLFYASVRNSISDTSFAQFFPMAEMILSSAMVESLRRGDTDDECFRNYRGVVAEISNCLNDSGVNTTLTYRSTGSKVKVMVTRVKDVRSDSDEIPSVDSTDDEEDAVITTDRGQVITLLAALAHQPHWISLNAVFK